MNYNNNSQSLEFVAETKILAEMKIESRGKIYFPWKKNQQAYFSSMKIKMMNLWMQIEGTKLIFIMNLIVLHFFKFASRVPQIAKILVSTFKVSGGQGGGACPQTPLEISSFFFHQQVQALILQFQSISCYDKHSHVCLANPTRVELHSCNMNQ